MNGVKIYIQDIHRKKVSSLIAKNRLVNKLETKSLPALEIQAVTHGLLLLLKKVGSARLRESQIHPISLKTPAPQYQPIDRKKRKGKRVEDYSRDRAF